MITCSYIMDSSGSYYIIKTSVGRDIFKFYELGFVLSVIIIYMILP